MSRQRAGFTLIELLIVVVIIGILAAIAIPKYQNTKGKAHLAAMRSDLHNLSVAQEGYYYVNQTYSPGLAGMEFSGSPGVAITINEATGSGWSATSTSAVAYPHTCAIFVGNATPVAPAVTAGVVGCN